MDGVVAAKAVSGREVPGLLGQGIVDSDDEGSRVDVLEGRDGVAVPGRREPARATGGRKSRSSFRVGENAGCRGVGGPPELGCELRPVFLDHELDQRRRVEVERQRRWSATRSDTEPFAFTRGPLERRGAFGRLTRP